MKVLIKRNENKIILDAKGMIYVGAIMQREGYLSISPLKIENYKEIKWEGIEFNNLFMKDGVLYRFNNWLGTHPYDRVEIEEIGTIIRWMQSWNYNLSRWKIWKHTKLLLVIWMDVTFGVTTNVCMVVLHKLRLMVSVMLSSQYVTKNKSDKSKIWWWKIWYTDIQTDMWR